jgi:hypothetical protein
LQNKNKERNRKEIIMSTSYYKTKNPISSIRVEKHGKYNIVTLFLNGQLSGSLKVLDDELSDFLHECVFDKTSHQVAHTYWGGDKNGLAIRIYRDVPDSTCLLNENTSQVTTLGEIKNEVKKFNEGRLKNGRKQ